MLKLYGHKLSSYCWKVMIALRELGLDYKLLEVSPDFPEHSADWVRRWPLAKMPLLIDGERQIAETSVIIEYLDRHSPGAMRLIPASRDGALTVRFLDRVFDNYVMTPMNVFVADRLRPEGQGDAFGVDQARALLDKTYGWLDDSTIGEHWAYDHGFTLADCAAAPSLFYADKVHPMAGRYPQLAAYLDRLLARPSVAETIAEAQPYWHMFPYA